jgi:hypothetical protein
MKWFGDRSTARSAVLRSRFTIRRTEGTLARLEPLTDDMVAPTSRVRHGRRWRRRTSVRWSGSSDTCAAELGSARLREGGVTNAAAGSERSALLVDASFDPCSVGRPCITSATLSGQSPKWCERADPVVAAVIPT